MMAYEVIATSNGHRWIKWHDMICCKDCGILRNPTDNNKPCQGPVKIAPRNHGEPDEILPE